MAGLLRPLWASEIPAMARAVPSRRAEFTASGTLKDYDGRRLLASTSYDATVAAVNGAGAGKATSKSFKTAKAATVPKGRPAAKGTIPATPATRSSAVSQDDEHTPRHSVRTYIPACYRLAPEPG